VLLGERLGTRAGLGALLIVAGVLLSELKGSASQPSQEVDDGARGAMG
jgi:drug/metabolite transporter (DMT)-like permease